VQDRADPLCREELELLATLQREGPSARRALEALGRVARCETVKSAIAAALASMSASATDPARGDQLKKDDGKRRTGDGQDKKGQETRSSDAKPEGQIRGGEGVDPADTRLKAEAEEAERARVAAEAEKRRKAEEADTRRRAEAEEERREALEAKRERDRAKEAARKKIETRKVEVKRKPETTTKTSSRGGTYSRCEAQIRAKYMALDPREYQIRLTQCLATGGVY
jgi:colicin import membrane protein